LSGISRILRISEKILKDEIKSISNNDTVDGKEKLA